MNKEQRELESYKSEVISYLKRTDFNKVFYPEHPKESFKDKIKKIFTSWKKKKN